MKFMDEALKEAKKAYTEDEVPIGAVICLKGKIISKAHNTVRKDKSCLCHAEINAIKKACKYLDSKTLDECEMYVTAEPCAMCSGAIILSRIKRLYIGTLEPKFGAYESKANLFSKGLFNHDTEVYFGINENECKKILTDFFINKRKKEDIKNETE